MALIIPTELAVENGLLQMKKFEPISYDEFEKRKRTYKDHNKRIGDRIGVDLSKEPTVVYFDRADIMTVLEDDPIFLTFMFSCARFPEYDGMRVVMCGMDEPGVPVSDNKIFEGYKKEGIRMRINKHEFETAISLFEDRIQAYEDLGNWHGVQNNIKENAPQPDPLVKLITEDETINRIGVYLAGMADHYNIMIVLSKGNFDDMVPTSNSRPEENQAYDNSTQCCQQSLTFSL